MMGNERTQEQREANQQGTRQVLKESKGQNGGGGGESGVEKNV